VTIVEAYAVGCVAGVLATLVVFGIRHAVRERRRRGQERAFLDIQAKLFGVAPKKGETNLELRERLTSFLKGPYR
jgi:hypothetical protein